MDDKKLAQTTRAAARRARVEAKLRGSRTVEAEHLLLALASDADSEVGRLLRESGLDHERLTSALSEERRTSLAFAGVEPLDESLPRAGGRDSRSPTAPAWVALWGASAKAAILRSHAIAGESSRRRMDGIDLLLGILQAELGTLPRALAIAGVDSVALIARVSADR
jgi:ATP-dependent Clp protease ATP-binding subunit ClpA